MQIEISYYWIIYLFIFVFTTKLHNSFQLGVAGSVHLPAVSRNCQILGQCIQIMGQVYPHLRYSSQAKLRVYDTRSIFLSRYIRDEAYPSSMEFIAIYEPN